MPAPTSPKRTMEQMGTPTRKFRHSKRSKSNKAQVPTTNILQNSSSSQFTSSEIDEPAAMEIPSTTHESADYPLILPKNRTPRSAEESGSGDSRSSPKRKPRRHAKRSGSKRACKSKDCETTVIREVQQAYQLAMSILPKRDRVGGPEAVANAFLDVHHVELFDHCLRSTAAAEYFMNVTHLYLQKNELEDVEGLQLLSNLQVLVLHHNRIRAIAPLAPLKKMMYLDMGYNFVAQIRPASDLPCRSLKCLNLIGNPCCPVPSDSLDSVATPSDDLPHPGDSSEAITSYRQAICDACFQMEELDNMPCHTDNTSQWGNLEKWDGKGKNTRVAAFTPYFTPTTEKVNPIKDEATHSSAKKEHASPFSNRKSEPTREKGEIIPLEGGGLCQVQLKMDRNMRPLHNPHLVLPPHPQQVVEQS
ncbi:unnamed protein product [Phytomonas sp. Hart1]|nr:unnamed protein product [Phytomonas sp. Hart1]|eukprot:CCW66743.1 unnamed protein product [Phytomonas sp. isolate Hart1]